ncbi:hypothetical protein [Streptomyces sp. SID14515]|uniref:hypothetical protein n=1 Tax=Streptomyces sp. SID14515 TaxID=2706074 RepID=UPI00194136AC|nr:hypothetical protein [Streptomyces sp. SID14515]
MTASVQPILDGSIHRIISDSAYRERTQQRIKAHSEIAAGSECWLWTNALDRDGYGVIMAPGRDSAHRAAYLAFVGAIPADRVLDHVCHSRDQACPGGSTCPHRRCVNPAHLEAVTGGVNTLRGRSVWALNARKTHCKHGHAFTPENTYQRHDGRACRTCIRAATARYRSKKRGTPR